MSPAVEDFLSPSSSSAQRSYFQNPNPSTQGHFTDSAAAAATVRSTRRKSVKVKKHSSCNGSASKKPVNTTCDTTSFVFNATTSGSVSNSSLGQTRRDGNGEQHRDGEVLDFNLLRFTMGSTNNDKLGNKIGTEEVQNSGNNFQPGDLNFVFGADDERGNTRKATETGAKKSGKLNDVDFVFGAKMNNGVGIDEFMNVNNNSFTTMADSNLVNSMSFLNLGSKGLNEASSSMNNNLKKEENNTKSDNLKFQNLGFVFSANHRDFQTDSNIQTQESKEKVDNLPPDYLKKQDNNVDSVLNGNSTFVFGSNSHETRTSNIHDPMKVNITKNKINEAETTNNFSFSSKVDDYGASFTGFNTPDINIPISFTSDMFPGLNKKLEFSKNNSVSQRKSKKTKSKASQQSKNCPQVILTHLSEGVTQSFEESPGSCSPMDVSPYFSADCAPTSSTNPTTSQNVDGADVAVKPRPHQKKFKMKIGRVDVTHTHKSTSRVHTKATDQETCETWRKRGNEAYKSGNLSEAEVCYTKGINSIQHTESLTPGESVTPGDCIQPLLLCYSNRAATRMALGRMREGLKDCRIAASLDPNFLKVNLRSANCHLLLGEIEDASYYYNKCIDSKEIVCLDRRITIEAADGLQNTQKVAEYIKISTELLEQKTNESANKALKIITDALSISCYSEKLLNMKGDALFMLGKHKEVVQLCEQTLETAEKNFTTTCKNSIKIWRWNLMSKSYFHLGRLETALDLIEKQNVGPDESLLSLSVTIRELLHSKNLGNEAFQNGKHTEAVEHYTSAISKSIESHSFAAVCFCNRAAANQSLGEILDAIGDCSIAIALDTSYSKALSRRATLLEMIRDYKHASDDLHRLISILELQNSQNSKSSQKSVSNGSMKDLRRARRRLSVLEEKAKKERSLDLYLILGIKATDGTPDVKKAYRKAALRHHPDKVNQQWKSIAESIQTDADRLFKMIGEAYAVLSDSTKRSKYDLEEEMWDEMEVGGSNRRGSDFYGSPESRKYGNSHYYYWQDPKKSYHSSYSRW